MAARATRRTWIVAVSAAGHAAVFIVLAWRLGETPALREAPAMTVSLVPPPSSSHDRAEPRSAGPRRRPAASDRAIRDLGPAATDQPAAGPGTMGGMAPVPPPEAVRRALRGALGCAHADLMALSEEERRKCETALAEGSGAPRLALRGQAEFDAQKAQEPYLVRKPKNGCKPTTSGDDFMGHTGGALRFECSWSF